jgi:hypothetical protein
MIDRVQLARQLVWVAQHLDQQGFAFTSPVRIAARVVLEVPEDNPHGCAGCGTRLAHPATGRRRKWCSERCRRRKRP